MTTEKKCFVGFPMLMSAFDHEGLFLPKEDVCAYMLYFLLGRQSMHKVWQGCVQTTIVTLSKQLPMLTKTNKKKESENKKEIKRLLLSLHDKGYITITHDEESLEYDTLLTISIPDASELDATRVEESHLPKKGKTLKHVGWVRVDEEMFDASNGNPWHLQILIYTHWRMGLDDYRISFEEWAKVLGVSENTAEKYVNEAVASNVISKQSGDFYTADNGKVRRLPNGYDAPSAEERQERQEKAEGKEKGKPLAKEVNTYMSSSEVKEKTSDDRYGNSNWTNPDTKVYLNGKDMVIWKECKCPIALAHAEKRWGKIPANKQKELMGKYNDELKNQKKTANAKKVVEEKNSQLMSPDEVAHLNRDVKFKKKSNSHADISGLLVG